MKLIYKLFCFGTLCIGLCSCDANGPQQMQTSSDLSGLSATNSATNSNSATPAKTSSNPSGAYQYAKPTSNEIDYKSLKSSDIENCEGSSIGKTECLKFASETYEIKRNCDYKDEQIKIKCLGEYFAN